jgi:manganese transport protein
LLWAVIVSCVIKYFLQIEFGRHTLAHDRTPLEALNSLPGPKFRGTSVIGLVFVVSTLPTSLVFAGMLGATAGMAHSLMPLAANIELSAQIWMGVLAVVVLAVLWRGVYAEMEKLITVLVLGFSISVVVGVFLIQGTEFRITAKQVASGLTFSLGENRAAAAIAVISLMGALGATANELFMYPYWILEKGYTRFTGPPESQGWVDRTRGWIRILQFDVGVCTLLTTVVTAAYFLIGAAVLHRQGIDPAGLDVVGELSHMFTDTYGEWSRLVFLGGAFCTLFSTMIVGVAAFARMWGDTLVSLKCVPPNNRAALKRTHRIVELAYVIVLLPIAMLSLDPAANVIFGQFFAGLVGMPLLMFAICWLGFRTDARVRMGRFSACCLVVSVIAIVACLMISTTILINKWSAG